MIGSKRSPARLWVERLKLLNEVVESRREEVGGEGLERIEKIHTVCLWDGEDDCGVVCGLYIVHDAGVSEASREQNLFLRLEWGQHYTVARYFWPSPTWPSGRRHSREVTRRGMEDGEWPGDIGSGDLYGYVGVRGSMWEQCMWEHCMWEVWAGKVVGV
jgi:hypothetical protein